MYEHVRWCRANGCLIFGFTKQRCEASDLTLGSATLWEDADDLARETIGGFHQTALTQDVIDTAPLSAMRGKTHRQKQYKKPPMEVTGFSDVFGGYSLPACISFRNLRPKWQLNDFGPFRLAMWPCACRVTIVPSNCAAGSSSCIGCSLNLCVSASVSHGMKTAKNVHKTRHRCSNSLVNSIQFNRIFEKYQCAYTAQYTA